MSDDKPYPTWACHVEVDIGEKPDDCVVNFGAQSDCIYARTKTGRDRQTPNGCKYWLRQDNKPTELEAAKARIVELEAALRAKAGQP